MVTGSPKKLRSAGRPQQTLNPAVRARLLEAARSLFAQHGYVAVSTRAVAEAAGASQAMIHYYFGSKQGLYEAMISGTFTPLVEQLGTLLTTGSEQPIRRFFEVYMHTLGSNPWMPPLILREVVAENGKLRQWFIREFATRGGGLLARLVQVEQGAGRLRADLDPTLTALSMVSLAVFPFVAMPIASAVFGMRIKPDYLSTLVTHTERLFREGVSS